MLTGITITLVLTVFPYALNPSAFIVSVLLTISHITGN